MNTDNLITMLATSAEPVIPGTTAHRHALALGWGGMGATLLMAILLGVRADIGEAVRLPMFWLKLGFPLCIAGAALFAATRLGRPGVPLGRVPAALVAPVIVVWLMAAYALSGAPSGERLAMLLGKTWTMCPLLIALLSVPVFGGTFWAMRGLAPTRPALAGASAGLLAGALATAVYALHCPEMAAPFLATWYLLGMSIPTVAGALLGSRLLRW